MTTGSHHQLVCLALLAGGAMACAASPQPIPEPFIVPQLGYDRITVREVSAGQVEISGVGGAVIGEAVGVEIWNLDQPPSVGRASLGPDGQFVARLEGGGADLYRVHPLTEVGRATPLDLRSHGDAASPPDAPACLDPTGWIPARLVACTIPTGADGCVAEWSLQNECGALLTVDRVSIWSGARASLVDPPGLPIEVAPEETLHLTVELRASPSGGVADALLVNVSGPDPARLAVTLEAERDPS